MAIESPTHETPNSSTKRARRVLEAHLALFNPQSTSNYAELLTDDAVYEFPFTPAGFPSRVEGKEAIIRQWLKYLQSRMPHRVTSHLGRAAVRVILAPHRNRYCL